MGLQLATQPKISKLSSITRPTGCGARVADTVCPVTTEKESTVTPMANARRPTRKSSLSAIAKILSNGYAEFTSLGHGCLCLRQMYDDPERLVCR